VPIDAKEDLGAAEQNVVEYSTDDIPFLEEK